MWPQPLRALDRAAWPRPGGQARRRRRLNRPQSWDAAPAARTRRWAVAEKSARKPSVSEADGKSVSPSAVTAPLMPTMMTASERQQPARQEPALPAQADRARRPPAHQAVNARTASSRKVLIRCSAMEIARPTESLSAVSPASTSHAPMSASRMMKTPEATRVLRTGWPGSRQPPAPDDEHADQDDAQARRETVGELDDRLELRRRGTTTPLQSGQWLPHPAPEPVARTNAPQRMTRTLYPNTPQANAANLRFTVIRTRSVMFLSSDTHGS